MDSKELASIRKRLNKTQAQIAHLLGTSVKAVRSYEQGWRKIPGHVERQVLFLLHLKDETWERKNPCWVAKECPPERMTNCPAWEFQAGHLCWFINGTICRGEVQRDWLEKMRICRSCEMLKPLLVTETDG